MFLLMKNWKCKERLAQGNIFYLMLSCDAWVNHSSQIHVFQVWGGGLFYFIFKKNKLSW